MMSRKYGFPLDQIPFEKNIMILLTNMNNELAEANRLKRLEIEKYRPILDEKYYNKNHEDLEDKA